MPQDIDGDELFAHIKEIDVRPEAFSRAIQWHERRGRKKAERAGGGGEGETGSAGLMEGGGAPALGGGLTRDDRDATEDERRVSPFARGAVQLGAYTVDLGTVGESISKWF